ncbi:uncharacterized protein LOC131664719 isoform X2 [Phymastichus coffea]|uniref:uncharacterized protein LOC131664719 isoform X2 n=1 Tax=Phymastichus coffea TaxID=108790 RepID=UPI00273C7C13|nr:uncharacterized protein LOC131664719 isoform X2 [Phymastichus coffea]
MLMRQISQMDTPLSSSDIVTSATASTKAMEPESCSIAATSSSSSSTSVQASEEVHTNGIELGMQEAQQQHNMVEMASSEVTSNNDELLVSGVI